MKARTNFPGEFSSGWDIEVIREPEELERVRPLWERLQWNPYYDIDWLRFKYEQPWCKETPHVFVMKRNGRPETIVAGEIKPLPIQFQIGYKRWQGPSLKTLFVSRYGVLGENDESLWSTLERYFEDILINEEAESVLLRDFDLNSAVHKLRFSGLPVPCKYKTNIVQEHWYVTGDRGLAGHRKKHKKFWRHYNNYGNRIRRKLGEDPQVLCYRKVNDLNMLLNHTEEISLKTWQRKFGSPGFLYEHVESRYFHFMERQLMQGFMLYAKAIPAAFFHGIVYGGRFYGEVMGYDSNYAEEGVGTYLIGRILEEKLSNPDGVHLIDLGVGNSEAKKHLCDVSLAVKDRYLVAPRLKFFVLNTVRVIFLSTHIFVKKKLTDVGLHEKIRSLWRHGLLK